MVRHEAVFMRRAWGAQAAGAPDEDAELCFEADPPTGGVAAERARGYFGERTPGASLLGEI